MMNKKSNQNHLDYWSGRSDEIFRYLDRKDIDFFAELNKVYQEQANEMQKAFYDFLQIAFKLISNKTSCDPGTKEHIQLQ